MAAFQRVLTAGTFVLGEEVERFENAMARRLGARHAIGVSSGTDALVLALMSLGIGPGDDVLCPSFTFFATAGSVARVGARPVFVDVDPDAFNALPEEFERRCTDRTKAVVPVHLFGRPAAVSALREFCSKRGIALIEDCAQALGARHRGSSVGVSGEFGVFSFYPTKILSGFGDAGLLTTNEDELAEKARALRVHGGVRRYYHDHVGGNFRLDAVQAALLAVKEPHVDRYIERRRALARRYLDRLGRHPAVSAGAGETRLVSLPGEGEEGSHCWNQFTLRVFHGRRDAFRAFLSERGVATAVFYPVPLHRQVCFAEFVEPGLSLPASEALVSEVVSLPLYPEMTEDDQDTVLRVVGAAMDACGPTP